MLVVCACYAGLMRLLCVYYASTMRLLCACYAGGMRLLCVRYASAMRLLCGCYAGVCPAGVCLVVGPLWLLPPPLSQKVHDGPNQRGKYAAPNFGCRPLLTAALWR